MFTRNDGESGCQHRSGAPQTDVTLPLPCVRKPLKPVSPDWKAHGAIPGREASHGLRT